MKTKNKHIKEDNYESWERPQSYREIKKKCKIKNPILSIKKIENICSIIFTIISVTILIILVKTTDIENVTEVLKNILLYIAAGLISMLGFIISGLAIATGTMSNEIIDKINDQRKYDSLLQVLFSFWYIGRVIGISIGLFFITYIVVSIDLPVNGVLFFLTSVTLSYCFYYIIFACVSLLKTCFNLFSLNFLYWKKFK